MRIGIVIGRIGGIDGVALETEKWIEVLTRLGHDIFIFTGFLQKEIQNVTIVPEAYFYHPSIVSIQEQAFDKQELEEVELVKQLKKTKGYLEQELLNWISQNHIDEILSENVTSHPYHLSLGWALVSVLEKLHIPAVCHNHDFHWERGDRYQTQYDCVHHILKHCFPVHLSNIKHVVINHFTQRVLKERLGIDAMVVPNVMDFSKPYARRDKYNQGMRQTLGVKEDDLLLFQITRIVRRKRIETAIQLVRELSDTKCHLVITGHTLDDPNEEYYQELQEQVGRLKLKKQIHFVGKYFHPCRILSSNEGPIYSLEDAYAQATACTYFSYYEGFGNAFLEAILAKKPIFVNNHKPVYWPDIGSLGFETVMIEEGTLTPQAVADIRTILDNPKRQYAIGEHNFQLGKQFFSYAILEEKLSRLFYTKD